MGRGHTGSGVWFPPLTSLLCELGRDPRPVLILNFLTCQMRSLVSRLNKSMRQEWQIARTGAGTRSLLLAALSSRQAEPSPGPAPLAKPLGFPSAAASAPGPVARPVFASRRNCPWTAPRSLSRTPLFIYRLICITPPQVPQITHPRGVCGSSVPTSVAPPQGPHHSGAVVPPSVWGSSGLCGGWRRASWLSH